ncbi:MAG TPA: FG-GAP-like repeat-containing protein, partial [Gemmatimonadaceae bacterium]
VDMLSADMRRRKTQIPTNTAFPKKPGDIAMQLQQQRNMLFVNRGDGTFAEVASAAGVEATGWSWSTMFQDVDLDGWQDILVANGHLWDIMDADTQERLQNRLNDVNWQRVRWGFPSPLKLKNVALRNRGDMTFEDVSSKWHFGTEEDVSHALAAGDLDGDGDLDVVVNRLNAPALVMRNDASAPRVAVRLVGAAPNTRAVGSKIRLLGGAIPIQEREIVVGGLYMSHSDYEASFAMGKSDSATLVIDWRDGRRTTIANVRPNRLYEVTASTASPRPAFDSMRAESTAPLFADVTSELKGHTHTEDVVDDWDRQFLLPSALSELGPGVSWFDVDRDGDEDLIIGSGKGGRVAVFRNDRGRLVADPAAARGPVAPGDFTSVLGWTENGATNLVAGVATWQARSQSEMTSQPAAVRVPFARGSTALSSTAAEAVGSHESSTGPLAMTDYDGDGDLDLFVGSRAIPMRYPVAASSGLFKNEGGRFAYDAANSELLKDVGLVSAAVFADVNGDGFDDLLVTREWGSILLLLNDGHGRFTRAPDSWGLSRWTNRWNGIAAGDLNGDGRLDLVATAWGRNTAFHADSARPLVLVHGPFGAAGEEEMILSQNDPRVGALAPLTSYARLRVAMPDLVNRLKSFSAYADATTDAVLGPAASRTQKLQAITLDHMAFINRGDHFEAVALPAEAQLAPAFYAGIADFDGDGSEDVFLSQNFSPTAVGIPRYDAGRGLMLLGDGTGRLRPISGKRSGVIVYGDQRGAAYADYDGDGRLDLVVSQNGAPTRLFHNREAKPGLRVRLEGSPVNPDAVGAQIRVVYGDKLGPAREIQAGSGYWSQNGAVQVLGLSGTPTAVWVRWPGGKEARVPVPSGAREVVLRQ